jgi:hypothetical protein
MFAQIEFGVAGAHQQGAVAAQERTTDTSGRVPTIVMRLDERAKARLQVGVIGFILNVSVEPIHHFYRQFGYFLRRVVDLSQTTLDKFRGQTKLGGFVSECIGQGEHSALRVYQQFWNRDIAWKLRINAAEWRHVRECGWLTEDPRKTE